MRMDLFDRIVGETEARRKGREGAHMMDSWRINSSELRTRTEASRGAEYREIGY